MGYAVTSHVVLIIKLDVPQLSLRFKNNRLYVLYVKKTFMTYYFIFNLYLFSFKITFLMKIYIYRLNDDHIFDSGKKKSILLLDMPSNKLCSTLEEFLPKQLHVTVSYLFG